MSLETLLISSCSVALPINCNVKYSKTWITIPTLKYKQSDFVIETDNNIAECEIHRQKALRWGNAFKWNKSTKIYKQSFVHDPFFFYFNTLRFDRSADNVTPNQTPISMLLDIRLSKNRLKKRANKH